MGIAEVSCFPVYPADDLPDLMVGKTVAMHVPGDPIMFVAKEIQDPLEVTGIAHIHGVGQGGHRGTGYEFSGEEVGGDHVIDVIGGKKCVDRKTQFSCHQSGRHVPVISAGDRKKEFRFR